MVNRPIGTACGDYGARRSGVNMNAKNMSTATSPMTGFSHIQLHVTDVALSEQWYSTALGMTRRAASAEKGYVALEHVASGVVIVLSRRTPDESDGGAAVLDHLAFAVPDGDTLTAWADHL